MRAASIVLVEDSTAYARLVELMLEEEFGDAVRVQHFERLAPAVERLSASRADCVLLDLTLPDARGVAAVARVRGAAAGTPIVVLSGVCDRALREEVVDAGARAFVLKGEEQRHGALAGAVRAALAGPAVRLAAT